MDENDIYRISYQRVSIDKNVAIPLSYGDLEKIIAHFKSNQGAFASFKEFARKFRGGSPADRSTFIEALHESIDRFVSAECEGADFPPNPALGHDENVIEELLRREGLDLNWGPK